MGPRDGGGPCLWPTSPAVQEAGAPGKGTCMWLEDPRCLFQGASPARRDTCSLPWDLGAPSAGRCPSPAPALSSLGPVRLRTDDFRCVLGRGAVFPWFKMLG